MESKFKKARKDVEFLKEYSLIASQRAKSFKLIESSPEIRKLVKKRREGGDKLVKVATALLICPDPVTGAVSLPLFAAAAAKSRKKSSDIERVLSSVNEVASELSSNRELSL